MTVSRLVTVLFMSLILNEVGFAQSATPVKNPLPTAEVKPPNSNTEQKEMAKEFSEYGFSPRTPKNQAPGAAEPSPKTQSSSQPGSDESAEEAPVRRGRRTAKGRPAKKPKGPLPDRATQELVIRPEDRSQAVVSSAATVRSEVSEVQNPIERPSFLVGVTLQQYEPIGRASLQGTDPVDYGSPGSKPMISLDLRWLPMQLERVKNANFGIFGSVGYVNHPLKIVAPTGAVFENASLSTFKTQLGVAGQWHKTEDARWDVRGHLGLGQFAASQSSSSSFASGSSSQFFYSGGLFYDYLVFNSLEASVGYELRLPAGGETPNLRVQRHNFLVGLSGGFQ